MLSVRLAKALGIQKLHQGLQRGQPGLGELPLRSHACFGFSFGFRRTMSLFPRVPYALPCKVQDGAGTEACAAGSALHHERRACVMHCLRQMSPTGNWDPRDTQTALRADNWPLMKPNLESMAARARPAGKSPRSFCYAHRVRQVTSKLEISLSGVSPAETQHRAWPHISGSSRTATAKAWNKA